MPSRIAVLLPRFSRYGGVEQFGYRLAAALASKGHAVDFICSRQEVEAPKGVRIVTVGHIGGIRFLKALWYVVRAERARKQGGYDLCISLGKTWNQDLVRVGSGPLSVFLEKSDACFTSGIKRTIKGVTRRLSPVNWLTFLVEKHQFAGKSEIIAVSLLAREWLLQSQKALDPSRVSIIYNRPDTTLFALPEPAERERCRAALWSKATHEAGAPVASALQFMGIATTNYRLKGLGPLIKALALLPQNVHLFVAGGRSSRAYVALAREYTVAERLHFCDKVDDMPAFMKALDIFVLPTYYDPCSNAALEALASGCRVITSAANGAGYFLPKAQILPDPGDVKDMAARIAIALAEPAPPKFIWPEHVPSGMEAFVERVEQLLAKRCLF